MQMTPEEICRHYPDRQTETDLRSRRSVYPIRAGGQGGA